MASMMASTLALSRPSEKLGTHSTSVDIRHKNNGGRRQEQPASGHDPDERPAGGPGRCPRFAPGFWALTWVIHHASFGKRWDCVRFRKTGHGAVFVTMHCGKKEPRKLSQRGRRTRSGEEASDRSGERILLIPG